MAGRLKSNKKGWEKLKKRLQKFDQRSFDVGFFRGEKYSGGLKVAEVAWINDQGSSTNPPRPFMTVDFKEFVTVDFKKASKHIFITLLFRKQLMFMKQMEELASRYADELKQIIYDYPGHNSVAWAEFKGFDDPLYYTGTMVNAVSYRVKRKKAAKKE